MAELQEFLSMGGYAQYVWSAYGLTLLILGGIILWSRQQCRQSRALVLARARRQQSAATASESNASSNKGRRTNSVESR